MSVFKYSKSMIYLSECSFIIGYLHEIQGGNIHSFYTPCL